MSTGIINKFCISISIVFFITISYAQKKEHKNFRPYLIDNLAEIEGDSLLVSDFDYKKILSQFEESFEDSLKDFYDFPGSAIILNKTKSQYIRLNSQTTDGYWSNYFTVGYCNRNLKKRYVKIDIDKFVAHSKIFLGINEKKIFEFLNKKPTIIRNRKNQRLIKFYWYAKESIDYLYYKIPAYSASFIFVNNKLVKFGFGRYKAELDDDFYIKH